MHHAEEVVRPVRQRALRAGSKGSPRFRARAPRRAASHVLVGDVPHAHGVGRVAELAVPHDDAEALDDAGRASRRRVRAPYASVSPARCREGRVGARHERRGPSSSASSSAPALAAVSANPCAPRCAAARRRVRDRRESKPRSIQYSRSRSGTRSTDCRVSMPIAAGRRARSSSQRVATNHRLKRMLALVVVVHSGLRRSRARRPPRAARRHRDCSERRRRRSRCGANTAPMRLTRRRRCLQFAQRARARRSSLVPRRLADHARTASDTSGKAALEARRGAR